MATDDRLDACRLRVDDVQLSERSVTLRLPFRFGVATITRATQVTAKIRISLPDGRHAVGVAAESLLPKWFDKNPDLSDDENIEQLRESLAIATKLYIRESFETPFELFATSYPAQQAKCAERQLNPLIASYGPALLDRALLDGLGRILGLSFETLIARNVVGLRATDLTPDLSDFDMDRFLGTLSSQSSVDVRHTVGFIDPLTLSDQFGGRVNDGLPETLEEVVTRYGCKYYKLKVCGDVVADLDRLARIADVLDRSAGKYRATLDGNEQYETVDGISELWRRVTERPALRQLAQATLFIEQPIKRAVALQRDIASLATKKPLIIDESDGDLSSFPAACALGYTGVSSKICKGFYKSILNLARVTKMNAELTSPRYFMSAEDLSTWAGVSMQQDLALVALLGITHVERNGHHFIDGMSFAPDAEQSIFAARHPQLYAREPGRPARLSIRDGKLSLGSLTCPGFAVGLPIMMDN